MEKYLSKRMKDVKPSVTSVFNNKVSQLRESGAKVYSLNVGEPDLSIIESVRNSMIAAIEEGKTKYTSTSGIKPLKEAIVEKLKTSVVSNEYKQYSKLKNNIYA